MGALTPSLVVKLEQRIQSIIDREYARLTANLWWQDITKVRTSVTKKDTIIWLLSTAQIRDQGEGGNIRFDDIVSRYMEIESTFAGTGLKLTKPQMEDVYNGVAGGEAMDFAAHWAADVGAYAAYWPQKKVSHLLKNGHTASLYTGYDGVAFFGSGHKVNPFRDAAGSFANVFTGAAAPASGNTPAYPGACPIDDSVSLDVALVNLGKIYAYISSIRMPNGEDPRMLRPTKLIVPPRMYPRAVQLTSAKFLAQVASSGAGSADVEAVIKALGYATPVQADELAGFESDTSFFIGCEQITSSQLGAVIYTEREAFHINFYGVADQAVLNRARELEWHMLGRNVVSPGHPFLIFKGKGS